jgi:hypothetical protein
MCTCGATVISRYVGEDRPSYSVRRGTGWERLGLIWLALAAAQAIGAAGDKPPADDFVLVQRVIDTRYDQTIEANLDYLAQLASPAERAHVVKPNETMQAIANTLFGINPTNAHAQYQLLVSHVGERNNLTDFNDIKAGQTLILPDLAPLQNKITAAENPFYRQPRVSPSPQLAAVQAGDAFDFDRNAFTVLPAVTAVQRAAAPLLSQWRWVPRAQALAETSQSGKSSVRSALLSVTLAGDSTPASTTDIDGDVTYLRTLLAAKTPVHNSVVYVLDDSWGDQAAFAASRDYFVHAATTICKKFSLGAPQWNAGLLSNKAHTDFPFDQDNRNSHARQVEAAVQPLAQLTSNVQVVYLPLFVEQKWSKEFLHEILRIAFTALGKAEGLEDGHDPRKDILDAAQQNADDVISRLPSKVVGSVARTDQAVIASLLLFAQLQARATGSPFFVSLSWTAPHYEFPFGPDPNSLGMPVAAVGNDIGYDVFSNKVLLALRAREYPGDVIAVMNAHSDGRVDCSSQWVAPANESVYGFVYGGFLSDGTCGTSFSTPRVAWILALRESFNPLVVDPDRQTDWIIQYRKTLLQFQNPNAHGFRRYLLSPRQVFGSL